MTSKKIKKWEYLNPIIAEITKDIDIEVCVLTEAKCMKALESVEITASLDGGTYPYKTKLGWCIVGPILGNKNGEALRCNRITLKLFITGKLLSHHFITNHGGKMRDVGVEEMFRKIYCNDFWSVWPNG